MNVYNFQRVGPNINIFCIWTDSSFGSAFRTCVLPEGLATEPPKMLKLSKYVDLIACAMVLAISTYTFNANKHP